jgi:hypothetical protein
MEKIISINKISEIYQVLEIQSPNHPLFSVISLAEHPTIKVPKGILALFHLFKVLLA